MNADIAGRVEMIRSLLGGEDLYDDFGNKTGEKTAQLITKEQAIELLNFKLGDDANGSA